MSIILALLMLAPANQPAATTFETRSSAQIGVGAQVVDCALVTGSAFGDRVTGDGCRGMQSAPARPQMCQDDNGYACDALVRNASRRLAHVPSLDLRYF